MKAILTSCYHPGLMGEAYIDISIPLDERTLVFPGDPQPQIAFSQSDGWCIGEYHGGLHAGTHLDAPWHAISAGKRLHEFSLGTFLGPCFVADFERLDRSLHADDLEALGLPGAIKRLLLKTRNSSREYWREAWDENAVGIDAGAAAWCADRGLCLLGIDYLSVEPAGESAAHRKLLENGIAILEGLRLGHVAAGGYELLAAPVNLLGTDAAWCRALLRTR